MKKNRVRYAPSPTGHLHMGGARSALINYLFAKNTKGDFIIRIEDTDTKRNIEKGISSQLDNLSWLGIIPDESINTQKQTYGPYIQSKRKKIYQSYAQKLIDTEHAYFCFCTKEEIEARKQGNILWRYDKRCLNLSAEQKEQAWIKNPNPTIRIKAPINKQYSWDDIVRGKITFASSDISDYVILKSDGIPTYNFAVVVDDYLMKISHVFRGEEHIANTPKQLLIYDLFQWEVPKFAHLTIITNQDGKKLSKRDGTIMQFIEQYKEKGYLPNAIFNYLALLGWSPKSNQEIMTNNEIIQQFDTKRLSKSPSQFNQEKLNWINATYIKKMDDKEYIDEAKKHVSVDSNFDMLVLLYKKEIVCFSDLEKLTAWYFNKNIKINFENLNNELIKYNPNWMNFKELLLNVLSHLEKWDEFIIKNLIIQKGKEINLSGKALFMSTRILITNMLHGPELFKMIFLLGKQRVIENLNKYGGNYDFK